MKTHTNEILINVFKEAQRLLISGENIHLWTALIDAYFKVTGEIDVFFPDKQPILKMYEMFEHRGLYCKLVFLERKILNLKRREAYKSKKEQG